jgi:hypothetical protein
MAFGIAIGKKARARKEERQAEKRSFKLEKIQVRNDAKSERVRMRTDAKKVAYANGINPLGDSINAVGGVLSTVAAGVAAVSGGGLSSAIPTSDPNSKGNNDVVNDPNYSDKISNTPGNGDEGKKDNTLLLILAAIAAFFLISKKR